MSASNCINEIWLTIALWLNDQALLVFLFSYNFATLTLPVFWINCVIQWVNRLNLLSRNSWLGKLINQMWKSWRVLCKPEKKSKGERK